MPSSGPTDERAALFAAGALPPDEAVALEATLLTGADDLAAFAGVVEALAGAIPAVEPPAGAKEKLLAALGPQAGSTPVPANTGLFFRFAGDGEFVPTPYPGVSVRILHLDSARQQMTLLMRMEPGAAYPSHAHDGAEECIVLEGELLVGDVRMRKGDYQRAEPGSDHVEQRSETGALLYLTAPISLLGR